MNADGPTAMRAFRDKVSGVSPKSDDQPHVQRRLRWTPVSEFGLQGRCFAIFAPTTKQR
jgi:hypothetical protein